MSSYVQSQPFQAVLRTLLAAFVLTLFLLSCPASAQPQGQSAYSDAPKVVDQKEGSGAPSSHTDSKVVSVRMLANTKAIAPGSRFKLGIELKMSPGWHTYYKDPGQSGMPTRVRWILPAGFSSSDLEWQKPHKFNESGIITYGYFGRTLVAATITAPSDLKAGQRLSFSARVKWLSCKEMCLPGNGDAMIALPVVSAGAKVENDNAEDFATVGFKGSVTELKEDPSPEKKSVLDEHFQVSRGGEERLSLLSYLGLAFVGGFILNFMPCVLPVISIKVLSFMQQAAEDPSRVFQLGLTFCAGIVVSFMALAGMVIAIQQAGEKVGWGFQFQYPVFVLSMAVIVLLFALSLFGLFYVQVTAGQEQIDRLARKEGFVGTFFKGVLATILSTPCTAPFLGMALGFAFAQPWWVILLTFFTISIGMAFPYILLTARPTWMRYLPKPGVWMEKFKESLGFLLMATVIWLIFVLGNQVGLNPAMSACGFLLGLSFAVWMVGRFTDLTSSGRQKVKIYCLSAFVVGCSYMAFLAPFPQLLSTNPQSLEHLSDHPGSSGTAEDTQTKGGIAWLPFSVEALDKYLLDGKTVFIDFTADWCLTCKVNESTVLNTSPIAEKFRALHVVALRADYTRQDPTIARLLQKFGRSGVPLYVIFPAASPSAPMILPEVITQSLVLDALDRAGRSRN